MTFARVLIEASLCVSIFAKQWQRQWQRQWQWQRQRRLKMGSGLHFFCVSLLIFFLLPTVSGKSSNANERDLETECNEHKNSKDEIEHEKEIFRQIDFCLRAGAQPITVVTHMPGARSDGDSGRGVFYMGEEPLPVGTTVGLYRALLVRKDIWEEWLDSGTIGKQVWEGFWKRYSVEFTNQIRGEEDITNKHSLNELDMNTNQLSWMAVPVGEVGTPAGIDGPTWWKYGVLPETNLRQAIEAINSKVLVDWERLATSMDGNSFPFFNAHILNEPSPGQDYADDDIENVSHLTGSGCSSFEEEEGGLRWCGTALEAKTSKVVYPGEQLMWCYGEGYERDYPVANTCMDDLGREG